MKNNLYWVVYKNLEKELLELANNIHIDDNQLSVYSVKIADLLVRTVIEVESLSKELYFQNGGQKENGKDLFFDTDCLGLLESKWNLSKKVIFISTPYLYFNKNENKILTPLRKANKRGTSSAKWLQAYQAVKHNRAKDLEKGNLGMLIQALAGLFILNIYYKAEIFDLGQDAQIRFDENLGSSIFSIKTPKKDGISMSSDTISDIDAESIYLIKTKIKSEELINQARQLMEKITLESESEFRNTLGEKLSSIIVDELQHLDSHKINNEHINKILIEKLDKYKTNIITNRVKEYRYQLLDIFKKIEYEAILNKN